MNFTMIQYQFSKCNVQTTDYETWLKASVNLLLTSHNLNTESVNIKSRKNQQMFIQAVQCIIRHTEQIHVQQ